MGGVLQAMSECLYRSFTPEQPDNIESKIAAVIILGLVGVAFAIFAISVKFCNSKAESRRDNRRRKRSVQSSLDKNLSLIKVKNNVLSRLYIEFLVWKNLSKTKPPKISKKKFIFTKMLKILYLALLLASLRPPQLIFFNFAGSV